MSKTYFAQDTALIDSPADEYAYPDGSDRDEAVALLPAKSKSPEIMKAAAAEALALVTGDRQADYGPPERNHSRTAEVVNWYIKHSKQELDGRDTCLINVLQKISRDLHFRKRDNLLDILGYVLNALACTEADIGT